MAIKAAAKRPWDEGDRFATTWYEPFDDAGSVARGVAFTLSVPGVHAFCTPGDLRVLDLALEGAEAFEPLDEDARASAISEGAALPSIFPLPV
jgi:hypothetical protein